MIQLEDDDVPIPLWGLPAHIADELAPAWNIRWLRWLAGWMAWLIMVGGFIAGWIWLWPLFEGLNTQAAEAHAIKTGALMYETNFGISMLIWIFAWIIFSAGFAGFLVMLLPMPLKGALFIGLMGDQGGRPFNTNALNEALKETGGMGRASDFLNAWASRYIGSTLKYALPIALFGAIVVTREIATFSLYSVDGYYRSPFLPWATETLSEWSDASRVELGCNQTDSGGSIVYKIHFNNGKSVRIDDGVLVAGTTWLDNMETIDTQLIEAGASFERWKWLKRDPLHPQCVRGFTGMLGKDQGDRLLRLLRVGAFAGDAAID